MCPGVKREEERNREMEGRTNGVFSAGDGDVVDEAVGGDCGCQSRGEGKD